jgi:hypothetical protein
MSISKLFVHVAVNEPRLDTEVCRTGDPMNACWI